MADDLHASLDWEKTVPVDLIRAVEHVQFLFDDKNVKCGRTTQVCCYADLHPIQSEKPIDLAAFLPVLDYLKENIRTPSLQSFKDLIRRNTPPSVLQAYFILYEEVMRSQTRFSFEKFLEIGRAHAKELESSPIEWAAQGVKSLICRAKCHIAQWLKECCDGLEEKFNRDNWQAPRLTYMCPALHNPYEANRVWERESIEISRDIAGQFTSLFESCLQFELMECQGRAELDTASKPKPELKSQTHAGKKVGREQKREPEFQRLAAALWRDNQGSKGRVNQDALKRIAAELDVSQFSKPSDYLEGEARRDLIEHNKKYGHSAKKVMTWTELALRGKPDQKRAFRKLLSRCASDVRK